MMMESYQHSYPDPIQVHDDLDDNEEAVVVQDRSRSSLLSLKLGVIAMLFVSVLALVASSGGGSSSSPLLSDVDMLGKSHRNGTEAPVYDYKKDLKSKEGEYDWQKCKESQDPDCWKKEGERVGTFWKSFGEKMRAFWKSMAFWNKEDQGETDKTISEKG